MPKKKSTPSRSTPRIKKNTRPVVQKNVLSPQAWPRRLALWGLLIVPLWVFFVFSLGALWYMRDFPDLGNLQASVRIPTIEIRDQHGRYLMRWGALHKTIDLDVLPPYVAQALLAVEDRRFFQHSGVDGTGILRALYHNMRHHKTIQGGSTLTQQLAKNLFLTPHRSLKRKLQEWFIALWLESHLTKKQILSLYLNRAYFGAGAYGIEAAARTFFAQPAQNLTLHQAVLLVGLLKAPSHYAPLTAPDKAQKRGQVVLDAMKDAGFLAAHEDCVMPPVSTLLPIHTQAESGLRYFLDWIVAQVHQKVGDLQEDLVVLSTLDPKVQANAEHAIDRVFKHHKASLDLQASCLCLAEDGAIRAMVGGRAYWSSPLNRVTQTQRPTGSSFKLFVYLCALERGWTPHSLISDRSLRLGRWAPQNYKWSSRGMISVSEAFAHSVNTATVRLAQSVGVSRIHDMARRLGVHTPLPQDLTLALGSGSMSVLQLGAAYHTLMSHGRYHEPYGIVKIFSKKDGRKIWGPSPLLTTPVLKEHVVVSMKQMLAHVVTGGTAKRAQVSGAIWLGAKTGTTQKHRDAWIAGLSEQGTHRFTTIFWVGYDDGRATEGITGGQWPAEMWQAFLLSQYAVQK